MLVNHRTIARYTSGALWSDFSPNYIAIPVATLLKDQSENYVNSS